MDVEDRIKLFGMSLGLVERDLDSVEKELKLDLEREPENDKDEDYYPQFTHDLRVEAAAMGRHYELFYCLEKSIRSLIAETLESAHGEKWWTTHVPQNVQQNVQQNLQREIDSGVSQRSEVEIDYTTFGELGEIVRKNWVDFGSIFSSEKAFTKIMNSLNVLRSPIAHCCPLAPDEVVRLQLTVRDWFRLME
jgi:Swt1-like HEPN